MSLKEGETMANLITRQFTISLDGDTLSEVEKVRFENHFDNRSLAISYLIELGLRSVQEDPSLLEAAPKKATRVKTKKLD